MRSCGMLVERLAKIVPPPAGGGRPLSWTPVERALGTPLPADYKTLVERYGAGSWDDFLHVFQPSHPNPHIDLVTQGERQTDVYDQLARSGEQMPVPVGDLLAVAMTDNGDVVFWHRPPSSSADEWPIMVNEARGPDWVHYPESVVSFLTDVLTGAFHCDVFPDDFPSEAPVFTPHHC